MTCVCIEVACFVNQFGLRLGWIQYLFTSPSFQGAECSAGYNQDNDASSAPLHLPSWSMAEALHVGDGMKPCSIVVSRL